MKLFGTYFSPFSRRVGAALLSRGIEFSHEPLNGYESPGRALELNPVGRVPILELNDGRQLADSWAILDWLDGSFPEDSKLLPAHSDARMHQLRLTALSTAICEITTALHVTSDASGPSQSRRACLEEQLLNGLRALNKSSSDGIGLHRPLLGEISTIVAFDYFMLVRGGEATLPNFPNLQRISGLSRGHAAFHDTRPGSSAHA